MTARNKNIPALRFKEFNNGWESKKLSDLTTKISDGLHSTPNYDDAGEYYFVNGNNLLNGKIYFSETTKRVSKEEYDKHKKDLSDKTILISINGTIGSLALYNGEKIILGKSAGYLNIRSGVDKYFVYNILQSSKIINFFISELTGSTIKNLSLTTIKNCEVFIPSLPEQQKIASFLSAIDEKIRQLTQKKELLEQYKKGVMQQLFSGKLRFKSEQGKAYPKWEEKKLGEVAIISMGQSPSSNSYNNDSIGKPLIQGNADIAGRATNPRQWTSEPTKECKIGDLILTVRAPVGSISKSYHNACIGRGVCSIRNKKSSNLEYLYQFLLDYEDKWKRIEQGSTFTAVNGSDISSIKINLPSLPEQQKIASFLSSLDAKIESVSAQIEGTQRFKKGLLQQMFV